MTCSAEDVESQEDDRVKNPTEKTGKEVVSSTGGGKVTQSRIKKELASKWDVTR